MLLLILLRGWLHFPCTVRVVDQKIFGVIVIFRCYYSGWSNDAVYVSVAANVVRCFVIVYSIFRHKWDFFRGLSCALIAQSVWVCICHSPFSIRIIIVRTFDNRTLSGTYALFLPVCTWSGSVLCSVLFGGDSSVSVWLRLAFVVCSFTTCILGIRIFIHPQPIHAIKTTNGKKVYEIRIIIIK